MKSRLLILATLIIIAAYSQLFLSLNKVAAHDNPRGMQVQQSSPIERRLALVIGNSAYKDSPLLNPVNDARDMAAALRSFGFEVLYGENISQNDMKRNIRAFGEKIRNGGVGLFYYAGHGIQVKGSNYLIPIDATITTEEEVEYESVDAGLVLAQMEAARNRLNIVILDACRNNPFARGFRSTQKGLASTDAPTGTLIAYATAPGSVASDGAGRNGLYTQELLKQMKEPGLSLIQMFMQVRASVRSRTEGKQVPWESSSLEGDFYFSATATASGETKGNSQPRVDPVMVELSFWESIKNSSDVEDYKEYLTKYPNGTFAGLARNKIRSLETAAKPSGTNAGAVVEPKTNGTAGAKPNSGTTASPWPLRGFEFDTVTVNSSGSVTNRRKRQAQYFVEVINGVALEMVAIPGGTFLMCSPESEVGREPDEGPQHRVSVPTFYMGKYEVTQSQWRAVASLQKVRIELNHTPSHFKGGDLPVESVLWEEAVEFCARLTKATGRIYRLPSEAEWEYACRAGATTPFTYGATTTPELTNYNGNYPYTQTSKGIYREKTTPVGHMGVANAFGLYDMHGNVSEWCLDTWSENYNNAPTDGSAWEEIGSPGNRVLRGGSWSNLSVVSRAARRYGTLPDLKGDTAGFRVVPIARTQ